MVISQFLRWLVLGIGPVSVVLKNIFCNQCMWKVPYIIASNRAFYWLTIKKEGDIKTWIEEELCFQNLFSFIYFSWIIFLFFPLSSLIYILNTFLYWSAHVKSGHFVHKFACEESAMFREVIWIYFPITI